MKRLALIICLIMGIMISGCATRKPVLQTDPDSQTTSGRQPRWVRYDNWEDNHPLLDMTAKSLCLALVGIGVLALAIGVLILEAQSNN